MMLKNMMWNLMEKQQCKSNCNYLNAISSITYIKLETMKKSKEKEKTGLTREEYIKVESNV
jgi:hypothetical protein